MSGGHVRQRSPGSYELRYRAAGRTITATLRGTRRDAERELRRLLTEVDKGGRGPAKGTVGEWFTRWLKIAESELSPMTVKNYRAAVEKHLRPLFGNDRLDRLTPVRIQEEMGRLTGLAASTRRLMHNILNASLSRAVELQVLDRNPCTPLRRRLPKVEQAEKAVLDPAQCAALVDAVRGTPMHAPVVLALGLGARVGEVAALRWSAISDDGVVQIAEAIREISARDKRRGATKTSRSRRVKLPAYGASELRAWRREQAEQFLRLGARPTSDTAVCTDLVGRALSPTQISDGFRRVKRRLGLPISYHGLRHTSASLALAAGATVKEVAERLGHSRPSMTLDIYSHVVQGVADDAADRLDAVMLRARSSKAGSNQPQQSGQGVQT